MDTQRERDSEIRDITMRGDMMLIMKMNILMIFVWLLDRFVDVA